MNLDMSYLLLFSVFGEFSSEIPIIFLGMVMSFGICKLWGGKLKFYHLECFQG